MPERATTTVSTNGQITLPKGIREALRWNPGTRLAVESAGDGVLLKLLPVFAETRPEDVFGSLPFEGSAKSPKEMDAGVREEARRPCMDQSPPVASLPSSFVPCRVMLTFDGRFIEAAGSAAIPVIEP